MSRVANLSPPKARLAFVVMLPLLLSLCAPISTVYAQDEPQTGGLEPEDIWSEDYANHIHPWGGDDRIQFRAYQGI